jgi:hypothetical protein
MHREKRSSDKVADSSGSPPRSARAAHFQPAQNRRSRPKFLGRHYPIKAGFILKSALSNSQQQPVDESQAGL